MSFTKTCLLQTPNPFTKLNFCYLCIHGKKDLLATWSNDNTFNIAHHNTNASFTTSIKSVASTLNL